MSIEITTAMVDQFKSNTMHLSQQRGSRLRGLVRNESITGKRYPFELIDATTARKRLSRHSDTPQIDTPHSRRWATLSDYDWADLVDNEDKARLLISPESEYAIAGSMAMGRQMDDIIIEAAFGSAQEGVDGTTSAAFSAGQTVDADYVESGGAVASNLTIGKLRRANDILGTNDVAEEIPRFAVVSQSQLTSLLKTTEVTSSDYNTVQALVNGRIDTFMGFKFVRTQRLTKTGNDRDCLFFAGGHEGGLGMAVGIDVQARMSERDDKNYALQVFLCMSMGAVRIDDKKVVKVICDETA